MNEKLCMAHKTSTHKTCVFTALGETNEALLIAYVLSGCRSLKALIISPTVEERSFLETPAVPHARRLTATQTHRSVVVAVVAVVLFPCCSLSSFGAETA